jgi:endonuclease/exonuclease/phosphatase (EEP) superfamily protein YafD
MDTLLATLEWGTVALGLFMAGGTLLSIVSRSAHWFVRGWDFPRPLIASLALLAGLPYAAFFFDNDLFGWVFLGAVGGCVAWQTYRIAPYMPLAPVTVQDANPVDPDASLRLLTSNVQQGNTKYDRWLQVARQADSDIILALEVNEQWKRHIDGLSDDFPYRVSQPQDNCYGMMLLSRLKLIDPTIRFVVQDDVPSIHTGIELRNGKAIYLHCVHPRPPEPRKDQHATARDAEVVIIGREIDERKDHRPTIIAGDFNDVAWSHTTELFIQLSGLLDPRRGRGLFNSFHAEHPWFRFPLDHVFHSNDFKLAVLRVLDYVGSDHFPVLTELCYDPVASTDQTEPTSSYEHEREAEQKVEKAAEHVDNDTIE